MSGRRSNKMGIALAGGGPLGAIYEIGALVALEKALRGVALTELAFQVSPLAGFSGQLRVFLASGWGLIGGRPPISMPKRFYSVHLLWVTLSAWGPKSKPLALLGEKTIRGGAQFFEPYPSAPLEPVAPFRREDANDVGQALPAGDAPLLDEDMAEASRLAQRVLDARAAASGQGGDGVDREHADAAALALAADDGEDGELRGRERGGELSPYLNSKRSLPPVTY